MKNKIKDLIQIIILQVIAAFVAIGSFSIIEVRNLAAMVAGLTFIAFGGFVVYKCTTWGNYLTNFVFWGAIIHLAGKLSHSIHQ